MTAPASLQTALIRCLRETLEFMGTSPATPEAPLEELLRDYGAAKARLGRMAVATRLGLNESDLGEFDRSLRRAADVPAAGESREDRIAALRALLWFETIWAQGMGRPLEISIPVRSDEEVGRKQVRAIELICRALLTEGCGDQDKLVAWLRELFRPEVVDKWLRSAAPRDVLSGTTFSELTSLFVSTESFARHRTIFERTAHLALLGDKRRTLQLFLEDVRRIRNNFAHHKSISAVQLTLLEHHFEELSAPVQAAFDRGETRVDPESFIDVSREELGTFFSVVREDLQGVKGDLAALKAALESKLDHIGAEVAGTAQTVQRVDRRLQYTLAGVAALVVIGGLALYFGRDSSRRAAAIQSDTAQIKADTTVVAQAARKAEAATAAVQSGVAQVGEQARQLGSQAEALRKDGAETRAAAREAAVAAQNLSTSITTLAQSGGIIANPRTIADFSHNARTLSQRGETDAALASYARLFELPNLSQVDPVEEVRSLLEKKYGNESLAKALDAFIPATATPDLRAYAQLLIKTNDHLIESAVRMKLHKEKLHIPSIIHILTQAGRTGEYTIGTATILRKLLREVDESLRVRGAGEYYMDPTRSAVVIKLLDDSRKVIEELSSFDEPLLVGINGWDSNKVRMNFTLYPRALAARREAWEMLTHPTFTVELLNVPEYPDSVDLLSPIDIVSYDGVAPLSVDSFSHSFGGKSGRNPSDISRVGLVFVPPASGEVLVKISYLDVPGFTTSYGIRISTRIPEEKIGNTVVRKAGVQFLDWEEDRG